MLVTREHLSPGNAHSDHGLIPVLGSPRFSYSKAPVSRSTNMLYLEDYLESEYRSVFNDFEQVPPSNPTPDHVNLDPEEFSRTSPRRMTLIVPSYHSYH